MILKVLKFFFFSIYQKLTYDKLIQHSELNKEYSQWHFLPLVREEVSLLFECLMVTIPKRMIKQYKVEIFHNIKDKKLLLLEEWEIKN